MYREKWYIKILKATKPSNTSFELAYATVTGENKIALIHIILLICESLNAQDVSLLHACNI